MLHRVLISSDSRKCKDKEEMKNPLISLLQQFHRSLRLKIEGKVLGLTRYGQINITARAGNWRWIMNFL